MNTHYGARDGTRRAGKLTKPAKSRFSFEEQSPAKKQNNILIIPQKPKTNSLKMPEFKAKIYTFSLWFMGFLM